jgi:hypothetical protein
VKGSVTGPWIVVAGSPGTVTGPWIVVAGSPGSVTGPWIVVAGSSPVTGPWIVVAGSSPGTGHVKGSVTGRVNDPGVLHSGCFSMTTLDVFILIEQKK